MKSVLSSRVEDPAVPRGAPGAAAGPRPRSGGWLGLAGDWSTLMKLRLTSLITLGTLAGALLGARDGGDGGLLRALEAALWITCSAASGAVLNQVLERETDKAMRRTAGRPLPTGTVSAAHAVLVGSLLGVAAFVGLLTRFNGLSAALSLASLLLYVAVYTPLKRVSATNTFVGAIAGAAPAAIGYVALAGTFGGWAQTLFAVIFAWQFPHFMAIAWIHREDYRRAGMAMVPALPDSEGTTALITWSACLALLPVSALPVLRGDAGMVYAVGAFAIGTIFTVFAVRFARSQVRSRARALFHASLVYLPAFLLVILADVLVAAA